ncbi:MAG TPA: cupin domain-containing protein [Croceibacterium sp.]|nr:cupin domain-containing protein [Croceibacterium sp.]
MAIPHAAKGEVVSLPRLDGADRSTTLVKTEQFQAIHLVVPAGTSIPPHSVAGQTTFQCLKGRVELAFGGRTVTLGAGDWLYLDRGEEHAVEGVDDSALLLTILF